MGTKPSRYRCFSILGICKVAYKLCRFPWEILGSEVMGRFMAIRRLKNFRTLVASASVVADRRCDGCTQDGLLDYYLEVLAHAFICISAWLFLQVQFVIRKSEDEY